MGIIPDMKGSYVDDIFQLIWTTRKSLDLLKRIQWIVEEAQKKNLSPEEVGEQIDKNAPELSDLKSFLPKTRVELYLLLTLLSSLIVTCQNNTSLSEGDVEKMIDDAKTEIEQSLDRKQKTNAPKEDARAKNPDGTKLGRNDPCYCGSGKKFKHCHYSEF